MKNSQTRHPSAQTMSQPLLHRTSVEAVVDEMLQVLRHAHLPHELVLVPVHTRQGSDVREDVLNGVGELEGVNIAETELNVSVDDELGETKNFTT